MALIVMKFGGTSVGTIDRIKAVAKKVKFVVAEGNQVAVVLSAMAGTTNQLVEWTREVRNGGNAVQDIGKNNAEYDVVVSSGEQITVGLLAIALQSIGVDARSWLGWQAAIRTDLFHGGARIERIECENMLAALNQGQVAVMAGFQGIADDNRITTLGRGGSDTSAVALAAALNADRCDIYTDVDGIYTTDPRIVPKAQKLDKITFEEMLELASNGAKVLQPRSVAMAMRHGVELQVLSSFEDLPGTKVISGNIVEDEVMEKNSVSGITHSKDEAKVTLVGLDDKPGVAASVFSTLANHNINVDMIVQTAASTAGKTDITFSMSSADLPRVRSALEAVHADLNYTDLLTAENICKVSVVGMAMRSQPGIARTMFLTLADKGINIEVIATSEIKISVLISSEYTELAVRSLHTAFNLDAKD